MRTDPVTAPRTPHKFAILAAASALALAVMLVRLGVFMQAPAPLPAIGWSATPWNAFITRHACATAYWVAAKEVHRTPDLYHPANFDSGRIDPATRRAIPLFIGPYPIDPYEYPPTFLLGPRLLTRVTPDFAAFRRLWGLLTIVAVLLGVAWIARRVDRDNAVRSLWLMPLALCPLTVFTGFQWGNVQLLFVVLAMLAMLAFERGRPWVGGLLLGYAIVGKLFPALLLVYLIARREWRAVAWTLGWCGVLTVVAIADLGWTPFGYFLDHLPRLLSGEAFPMLRMPGPGDVSLSVPGTILKVPTFGGPAVPFAALKFAGWVFSAVILWITVSLALRPVAPRLAPLAWLAILGLATLRSPFLPGYGAFQATWTASILLALCWSDVRRRALVLALWAVLLWTTAGPPSLPPIVIAAITTTQTVAILLLLAIGVRVGREATPSVTAAASPA